MLPLSLHTMRETLSPPAPRAPAASALRSQRARPSWHACVGGTTSAGSSAAPGTPVRARHATNQRPCCTGATLCVATRLGQRVGARGGRKRREQRTSALAADCAQRARVRAHEPAAAAGQPEALRRAQRRALTARRHGRARRSRRGRLCSRGARARGRHQPNARSAPHPPRRAAWRPEPSAQLPRGCGAAMAGVRSWRETGEKRGAARRGARGSLAHELRNNPVYVAVNWVIPYLLPGLLSLSVCVCLSLRLLCLCSVCMYVFVCLCARAARKSKRSGGARATRSFRITPIYNPKKLLRAPENRKPGNYSPIGVCSHRLIPLTSASSLPLLCF